MPAEEGLTADQEASLVDRIIEQVSEAIAETVVAAMEDHERRFTHESQAVEDTVKDVLAGGSFQLPGGKTPRALMRDHDVLLAGQELLSRNVDRMLDVVVGPVRRDFLGDPVADGERDESEGLMGKTKGALTAIERLDSYLQNGGVPVRLPKEVKAAIWTAVGTVMAAAVTTAGFVIGG